MSCERCEQLIEPGQADGESYCYYCLETIRVCYKLTIRQYKQMKHLGLTVQVYRRIFIDPRAPCLAPTS